MKLSKKILLVIAFIFLIIGALYRTSGLQYHMWEDEVHHNDVIFGSNSLIKLRHDVMFQYQPVLEYAIRKIVWFNILNPVNDTALRVPSAFYAILTLIIGFYFFWEKKKIYSAVLFVMLFFSAAIEIQYAQEARHYSFVSLAGLLFIMAFLNLLDCSSSNKKYGRKLFLFYLFSLLLLNAHFFSIFLVLGCSSIILLKDLGKRDLLIRNISLILTVLALTVLINYPSLHFLFKHPPSQLNQSFSIPKLPYQEAYRLFLSFSEHMSQIGTLKGMFPMIKYNYPLLAIIGVNLIVNFSRKRFIFYSSVLISLYLVLLYSCYRSNYTFGERYLIFYSPILVILTIDSFLTLLFCIPVICRKFFKSRPLSPRWINKGIKVVLLCCFIYVSYNNLKVFPYNYESMQRIEDMKVINSIKSLALHIRQEGKKVLILELANGWEMDQWNMYLNYLYKNTFYKEYPAPKATTRCLGDGVKNIYDLKNEDFDAIYIGDVNGNPFGKTRFKSSIYVFDNIYYYIKIYRKDNRPMKYDDIFDSFKIIDPDKKIITY